MYTDDVIFRMFMNGLTVKRLVKLVADSERIPRKDAQSKVEHILFPRNLFCRCLKG